MLSKLYKIFPLNNTRLEHPQELTRERESMYEVGAWKLLCMMKTFPKRSLWDYKNNEAVFVQTEKQLEWLKKERERKKKNFQKRATSSGLKLSFPLANISWGGVVLIKELEGE